MKNMKVSIWLSGLIAIIVSVIANDIVLFVLKPLVSGPVPLFALNIGSVSVLTAIGALGATIVYAILRQFMRSPNKTFIIISVIVFLLSLIPDYMLLGSTSKMAAGATIASVGTLMFMHLVAAVIIVGVLVKNTKGKMSAPVSVPPMTS
jgi:Family of unknown function (DUF6069)